MVEMMTEEEMKAKLGEKKICPLSMAGLVSISTCAEESCAWWDEVGGRCVVVVALGTRKGGRAGSAERESCAKRLAQLGGDLSADGQIGLAD